MLKDLLKQNKSDVIQIWFESIIESYPAESGDFLKNKRNRFGNPIGYTISSEIEILYDILLDETVDNEKLKIPLENIIKIRSIQDFSASQAVNFVFILKDVIRNYLQIQLNNPQIYKELIELDSIIDSFAMVAFDIYMNCREKLYEIRVNESKRKTSILLERINLTSGSPEKTKD